MSLEALDAVVWDGLETGHPVDSVEAVARALRKLARAGAQATEEDCYPLYSLVTKEGHETPSAAAVALPFVVALAADPAMGARVPLVELLTYIQAPDLADEDWTGARALLADPEPAVRRAAVPLAGGVARLLERWREETDPAVRLSVLLALGEAAADPRTGPEAATDARAVLTDVLGGDDPVMWVAAVHASAGPEPASALPRLERLVEVFSDRAVRPRFEDVWFVPSVEGPCTREDVLWWIARLFEHAPQVQLSFLTRLIEAAGPTGDALLCREAMDIAWRLLVERPSAGGALLPLAGALLGDPDGAVRYRAASMLAVLGQVSAPYADRLAELLDDGGTDEDLDGTVGEVARWALTRIGDPRALPGLVAQLRAQEEQDRCYATAGPRRPEIKDVLIPLRAHVDVLLPAIREAIREDGARGAATRRFVEVLQAWGEDALPALPDLLPLLADTWTSIDAVQVLRGLGPAAASAEPALRSCQVLDHPGNHWLVARTLACIAGDRAAAFRLVGDAVRAAEDPESGPFGALADFGRDAAPFAERVRSIMENGTHGTRLTAAVTLWSITGRVGPTVRVLEEFVLPIAEGGDHFGSFRDALRALLRIGGISPAIRGALLAVQPSDHRLSQLEGYERIFQDEQIRALIEQALACPDLRPDGTS
ncbi:hypothetical protein [Streptomyces sp. NRRL B-24484]|uniref:hypothetical protein n=1 Tax=Streptomyces sp. NRRL B-24484 TaxID=1463833 RepID=UPI0004BFECFE|nr:hypothetical protein [Streptomyces sp. NRRL B-24484]